MLDIGVGTGRTTLHFAKLCHEYIGIDYSENMIKLCRQRFPDTINFLKYDARDMSLFKDNYFDFILFSFNGLDVLAHSGRIQALEEIHRISRKDGWFCFSSMNLNYAKILFSIYQTNIFKEPISTMKKLIKYPLLRLLNLPPEELSKLNYALIRNGSYKFRFRVHYSKPEYQIKQLKEYGFKKIRIFLQNGLEVSNHSDLELINDHWLHYLCRKK